MFRRSVLGGLGFLSLAAATWFAVEQWSSTTGPAREALAQTELPAQAVPVKPLAAVSATPSPATVSIDKPVHFLAADGSDVLVAPGTYGVEATESRLRLAQGEGKEALVIQAQVGKHNETLSSPVAFSIPVSADKILVLLAEPGGTVVHAAGSVSGVRTRGGGIPDFGGGIPGGISWPNRPGLAVADPPYQRFSLSLGGAAVFDAESGLHWARQPSVERTTWLKARGACANLYPAGTSGWRLPTFPELGSLVLRKPRGTIMAAEHPFTNVQSGFYWSATTEADRSTHAWQVGIAVTFRDVTQYHVTTATKIGADGYYWCVRGGSGAPEVY